MKQHMISFFPGGSVQIKINLCSYESSLIGNFINCVHEPGVQVGSKLINCHDGGSESESESDKDFHNENEILF